MKVSEMRDYELLNILEVELLPQRMLDMNYDDMHRAEMALPEESWEQYLYELQIIATGGNLRNIPRRTPRLFAAVTATPRQRAEAMVRVLGGGE